MESVLQLRVTKAIYNWERPYYPPRDKQSTGSGFVIDAEKRYILTNAHVVENATLIVGRSSQTGRRDLDIELISISREKDLALCRLLDTDIKLQALKFGDSMLVNPGDNVTVIGYPLDLVNVKITSGVASGFEVEEGHLEIEDAISRSPAYIQISAPINPGNSGGPLLNEKNEVIGVIVGGYKEAQNIGYAIPSRTFLSIYSAMLNTQNKIVKSPTLSLEWSPANEEILLKQVGVVEVSNHINNNINHDQVEGIYVRNVYPDSCVTQLEHGDIITQIDYTDPFGISDFSKLSSFEKLQKVELVSILLDNFGMSRSNSNKYERKLSLAEIMDMVPIGSDLTLTICRNKNWYVINTKYLPIMNHTQAELRIPQISPVLQNGIDYEIIAGICIVNLDMKYFDIYESISCLSYEHNNLYEKKVLIVQIVPGSKADRDQILGEGQIIETISCYDSNFNLIERKEIYTLDDIRDILKVKSEGSSETANYLEIQTNQDYVYLVKIEDI